MIAFGCSVSEPEAYRRYAEPGITRVREPDSRVYPFAISGSIARSYNLLCESAARCEDLEALVLVHPHAELDDPRFAAKVRAALADPEVALLGVLGAAEADRHGLAWWRGRVSRGDVVQRYTESGGGEVPAFAWADPGPAPAEVDALDGFVLVLSAWAVRHVAFDEGLMLGHGFDVDYCREVRAAGRRVTTIDARVVEHRPLELVEDRELWVQAHMELAGKWATSNGDRDPRPTGPGPAHSRPADPRAAERRARRAEAESEAARTVAYARRLTDDAELERLEARLDAITTSREWRLTRPLRELNHRRRERG